VARAGPGPKRQAARLAQISEQLAQRLGDPYLIALITGTRGAGEYLVERWRLGLGLCDQADQLFRDRCTGVAWEMATMHTFGLWSLLHLGETAEVGRRCPALVREAQTRGDLYAATNLLSFTPFVHLMADDPASARLDIKQALAQWTHQGYHIQHYALLQAQVAVELYAGNNLSALAHVAEQWPEFAGSFLKRVQLFRVDVTQLYAYCTLAAATAVRESRSRLREAEAFAKRLRRESTAWSGAAALYVQGTVAAARRDRNTALKLLGEALAAFQAADMNLHAAAVRRRLGELTEGAKGKALVAEADEWMAGQQIKNPARMAAVFAPGFLVRG
jgi:hypothetical protein